MTIFSRGHATLELALLVHRYIGNISKLQVVFALRLLTNHLGLDCCVSGLVVCQSSDQRIEYVGEMITLREHQVSLTM